MDNMAATQRHDKRMGLRNHIRNNHINDWIRHQRSKQDTQLQQMGQMHVQNTTTSPISSQRKHKGHQDPKVTVELILFGALGQNNNIRPPHSSTPSRNCHELSSGKQIGSQTVRKVWQLALRSQSVPCLSELSMEALLASAEIDFDDLVLAGSPQISSRLGQTLWVLSNEFYKNPEISLKQAAKAIHLSVKILCCKQGLITSPKSEIDEYIVGLCVILLGNICVSEKHVQLILQQVKLKSIVSMLDGLLDPANQEDLSFVVSNILYYFPYKFEAHRSIAEEQADSCDTFVKIKSPTAQLQMHLELAEVLNVLQTQLYGDLLRHLGQLTTPTMNSSVSKSARQHQNKNGSTLFQVCGVSRQERQDLNACGLSMISENYTNDLLQCVVKVKELMHDSLQIRYQAKACQEKIQVEEAIIKEMMMVNAIEQKLVDVAIRVLLASQPPDCGQLNNSDTNCTPIKQKRQVANEPRFVFLKHRNVLTFVLDVYRTFETQAMGVLGQQQVNANRKMQQFIIRKYSSLLFDYSHRFLAADLHSSRIEPVTNRTREEEEILAEIEQALWEVYCRAINSLKKYLQNHEQFEQLLDKEISWIESKLISTKVCLSPTCESKLIGIIGDAYPIILRNHFKKEKRNCKSNKRDSILLRHAHELGSENSASQSQESTFEYIEIDMVKLTQIMALLECKIREHQHCQIMLLAVLRAVNLVVCKVRSCFNGATLDIENQREIGSTQIFPVKLVLGQPLYELISHQLKDMYQSVDEDDVLIEQINSQIDDIISTVEPIKEEDETIEELVNKQQPN